LNLAQSGKTILLVSSEYERTAFDLFPDLCDAEGAIVAEYPVESATEENLLYSATVSA
jgi:hypothetical protein